MHSIFTLLLRLSLLLLDLVVLLTCRLNFVITLHCLLCDLDSLEMSSVCLISSCCPLIGFCSFSCRFTVLCLFFLIFSLDLPFLEVFTWDREMFGWLNGLFQLYWFYTAKEQFWEQLFTRDVSEFISSTSDFIFISLCLPIWQLLLLW